MKTLVVGTMRPDIQHRRAVLQLLEQVANTQTTTWLTDGLPGISEWLLEWAWSSHQPVLVFVPTTREQIPYHRRVGKLVDRLPPTAFVEAPELLDPGHPAYFTTTGKRRKGAVAHFLRNQRMAQQAGQGIGFFRALDPANAQDALDRLKRRGRPVSLHLLR